MWRKLREAEWQFSPSGVYRVWPLSACDSRPNRYAVRWFKAIITSTLVDGWWCLSCGCWSLMNETLVNTTKNVIRGPPPADSRQSREKKRWVCKCVFSTITTYRHTRRDHLPLRHFILTGLSNSFYSCSALLNKRWKNGEKTSGGKYVSLWMCVCVSFWECDFCLLALMPPDQMICVQQGVPPVDMHDPYKVALYIGSEKRKALQMQGERGGKGNDFLK